MDKHEEILSKYTTIKTPEGIMYATVITKENALKAMKEAVEDYINTLDRLFSKHPSLREQPLREALAGLLNIIDNSYGVYDHDEEGAKDTGISKWAVFKEEILAARTALASEGNGIIVTHEFMHEVYNLLNKKYDWQNDKNAEVKQYAKVDRLYSQIMKLPTPPQNSKI